MVKADTFYEPFLINYDRLRVTKSKTDRWDDMDINDALDYLNNGEIKKGKKLLEELRKENPKDEIILYNLGIAYSESGQYEESAETLEEALVYNPLNANVLAALGFTYARMGETNKAIQKLEYAIKADPDNFYALRNLAGLYGKVRDFKSSYETFRKAQELQPDSIEVKYGIAQTQEYMDEKEKAMEMYEEILSEERVTEPIRKQAQEQLDGLKREQKQTQDKEIRTDGMFYCLAALEKFSGMPIEKVKKIAFEIAYKGINGIDISSADRKYTLDSLEGEFTGFQMVCYEYVGFKMFEPTMDIGIDLQKEYDAALKMYNMKKPAEKKVEQDTPKIGNEKFFEDNGIPENVRKIISNIEETSGKPIKIEYVPTLNVTASTKIGFKGRDAHIIQLNKKRISSLSHMLLHECCHIKRFVEADEEYRVVPATDNQRFQDIMQEIKSEADAQGVRTTDQVIEFWVEGLVQQLTSLAVDFRIERWIYDNFPEIRKEQAKALQEDAHMSVQGASNKIMKMTPSIIFNTSNAINYAYLYLLFPITKEKYNKTYYAFPKIVAKGKRLLKLVPEKDKGQKGDIELINKWAEALGIEDWFVWRKF